MRMDVAGLRAEPAGTVATTGWTTEAAMALKGAQRVCVVIPARDEGATVGSVVSVVGDAHLAGMGSGLVDRLVVVDDGSADRTARVARAAGATVHRLPRSMGKGRAMAEGVLRSAADLVVFLDADVVDTDPGWIPRLLGPLLADPAIELVKGYYERPLDGQRSGGGRVTELAARPVLSLLFPELASIRQPLAGETAVRRATLLAVGLEPGYGVEMGLLIDVARRTGASSIAQVDLGRRTHRNRPLAALGAMSREVLRVALARSGVPTA